MRLILLLSALVVGLPDSVCAQATDVSDDTALFCRDSSGTFQPFVRTNVSRLRQSFIRQFGWRLSFRTTSPEMGILEFGTDQGVRPSERIYYDVQPYAGGIVLLHMHVRLKGKVEDLTGTKMCMQTFAIVNVQ